MDVPESSLEDIDKEKVRWFLRKTKSERGFDIDEDTSVEVYMPLKGAEDSKIVKYALSNNRVILTQDKEFGSIWYFSERGKIKVIVLRPKVQSIENLKQILDKFLPEIGEYSDNALFVVDESKYRIRK